MGTTQTKRRKKKKTIEIHDIASAWWYSTKTAKAAVTLGQRTCGSFCSHCLRPDFQFPEVNQNISHKPAGCLQRGMLSKAVYCMTSPAYSWNCRMSWQSGCCFSVMCPRLCSGQEQEWWSNFWVVPWWENAASWWIFMASFHWHKCPATVRSTIDHLIVLLRANELNALGEVEANIVQRRQLIS